jgi:hypothetical protein
MLPGTGSCASCHALPPGTNGLIIPANVLQEPQQMKIPQLRNLYRRVGAPSGTQSGELGFGFTHDGALASLTAFLAQPVFSIWPQDTKDDIVEFLLAFDSGEAPTVGRQTTLDATNAGTSATAADCALLETQAALGNCELVGRGVLNGWARGLCYEAVSGHYTTDRTGVGPFTRAQLVAQALAGQATWTLMGVPLQSSTRLGVDRDLDGVLDGDEGVTDLGGATAACSGGIQVFANGSPELGNSLFAVVAHGAQPFAPGFVVLGVGTASVPFAINAVPTTASLTADAHGFASASFALPNVPALIGKTLQARAFFGDPCAPGGLARSNLLRIVVQP